MEVLPSKIEIIQKNGISLWQPCKKVIKNLSKKNAFEIRDTSILLMYPKEFETVMNLTYPEILFWLKETNLDDHIMKLELYKLTVTSAPAYMYDDDYIKYWIENDEHHRLTGSNNWALMQSDDGEIILFFHSDTANLHAELLTHQCMIDVKL